MQQTKGVVVTGASTGIGEATALHLDQAGYRVFAGVRKQEDAERLQNQASDLLVPIQLDVTKPEDVAAAAEKVSEIMGPQGLFGLVNNAGVAITSPLEFIPIPELRRQLEINVIGQMTVTQAFLPLLRRYPGRIVFISSISGRVAAPLLGPYSASKFALGALAGSLRRELMPWNIMVSLVEPGKIETPIWKKTLAAAEDLVSGFDSKAEEFYGEVMRTNQERAQNGYGGTPSSVVAETVEHVLTSRRPKTRYLVGRDARMGALLVNLIPERMLDYLIAWQRGVRPGSAANKTR